MILIADRGGSGFLEISKFPQPLFDKPLLCLIQLQRFVAQEITQNKRQQFVQAAERVAKFLFCGVAKVRGQLHVSQFSHASTPAPGRGNTNTTRRTGWERCS